MPPSASKKSAPPSSSPLGSTARRRTLWIGLALLAVAAWMFFLGILVGRGTAPLRFDIDRLEQELAALRQTLEEKERQLLASNQSAQSEIGFTFFDDLKQSEEQGTVTFRVSPPPSGPETNIAPPIEAASGPWPATGGAAIPGENAPGEIDPAPAESASAALPRASSAAAVPENSFKPKKSLKQTTLNRAVPAQRPAGAAQSSGHGKGSTPGIQPAPQPAVPGTRRGSYTIQVSAVQDAGTASAMVARLKAQGYDAHQSVARIPGKGMRYRIRVGRFTHSREAQSVVRRLKRDNYDAMLVPR